MKFPQLPVGARFRYQGEIYCKTSPLGASGPDGGQRMIPRSASVELLSTDGAPSAPASSPVDQALAEHHQACLALLREAAASGPDGLAALEQRLEQARTALVAAIT